ncbi:hypothetical protein [Corynebacterium pacaense]|uniref:hypothetical protein n=1 Tax=Corynebacterium pacaense TaxID=1816684 RepID=UPI0009BBC997|nr:hypothetical protein [Corynebacterium pacaense]
MRPETKIAVPWAWYLGIVGVIILSAVFAPGGVADARIIAGPVLVACIGGGVALLISSVSGNLAQMHPEVSQGEVLRRGALLAVLQSSMGWFSFFFSAALALAGLRVNGRVPVSSFELVAFFLLFFALAWVFIRTLRQGCAEVDRIHPVEEGASPLKWGIVYHNPSDARVFVELEDSGSTVINMARPAAWGVLALLVVPAAFIVGLVIILS